MAITTALKKGCEGMRLEALDWVVFQADYRAFAKRRAQRLKPGILLWLINPEIRSIILLFYFLEVLLHAIMKGVARFR